MTNISKEYLENLRADFKRNNIPTGILDSETVQSYNNKEDLKSFIIGYLMGALNSQIEKTKELEQEITHLYEDMAGADL